VTMATLAMITVVNEDEIAPELWAAVSAKFGSCDSCRWLSGWSAPLLRRPVGVLGDAPFEFSEGDEYSIVQMIDNTTARITACQRGGPLVFRQRAPVLRECQLVTGAFPELVVACSVSEPGELWCQITHIFVAGARFSCEPVVERLVRPTAHLLSPSEQRRFYCSDYRKKRRGLSEEDKEELERLERWNEDARVGWSTVERVALVPLRTELVLRLLLVLSADILQIVGDFLLTGRFDFVGSESRAVDHLALPPPLSSRLDFPPLAERTPAVHAQHTPRRVRWTTTTQRIRRASSKNRVLPPAVPSSAIG